MPMLMKCPRCPEATLVATDRQEIEIEVCPSCRGVWLDRGELDKLIERSRGMAAVPRGADGYRGPDGPRGPEGYRRDDDDDRWRSRSSYERRHDHDDDDYKHRRKQSWLKELFD